MLHSVLSVLCPYTIMCSTPHQVLPKSIVANITDPKPVFELNGIIGLPYLISVEFRVSALINPAMSMCVI